MNEDLSKASKEAVSAREGWILAALGFLSLAPYLLYQAQFGHLFWYGDEFDLIDQIDRMGFWRWVGLVFAENFVPLFKILWGGAVFGFGGSYAAMMVIVWLTHALNVMLLGRLMRRCGLSWLTVALTQVVFGLTRINYETLGWSVQWSAVLSITFLLAALDRFFRSPTSAAPIAWAVASALSFSRGVLTSLLLALTTLLSPGGQTGNRRFVQAGIYLLPAVAVGALIALLATGNHKHMGGHFGEAAVYGLWYLCLNPAHELLSVESWGWRTTLILGVAKGALIVWTLARSRGPARILFVVLVVFDLGNSALLGVGRYHTGILTTLSSRYQYASLLATIPLAAHWVDQMCREWIPPTFIRRWVGGLALVWLASCLCRQWHTVIDPFTTWRGTDSRKILFVDAAPGPRAVPGIPGLPMYRAKALIAKYHLH